MTRSVRSLALLLSLILILGTCLGACAAPAVGDEPTTPPDSDTEQEPSASGKDTPDTPETDEPTEDEPSTDESVKDEPAENEPTQDEVQKPTWEEDGVLKILTIGNSFSDDTMQYVYQIASALGIEHIELGNLYIGGCTLDTHAANARTDAPAYDYRQNENGGWATTPSYRMSAAIASKDWDFITLQQASGSSGIASTYTELDYMISYVKSLCPTATIGWNMTWAYQQNSTHGEFPKYSSNQMTMYKAILTAVNDVVVPHDDISFVVPCGTAVQNARTSYIGDTLTRDGFHLSTEFGRYIAGLTLVYTLTGLSPENISYAPVGVDERMKQVAIEAAINAVNEPFAVSESEYTDKPALDLSLYDELDLGWTAYTYWHASAPDGNHNRLLSNTSFYGSRQLTREELPVGSVIVLADGWTYRPDGWITSAKIEDAQRPAESTVAMLTVTEAWWGSFTKRAFNLFRPDRSSLEGYAKETVQSALKVYVPKGSGAVSPSPDLDIDLSLYSELDLGWTPCSYWNAPDPERHHTLYRNSSLADQFYASRIFSRDELPVGSIIVLADGWKYRPDAWSGEGALLTPRPDNTTVNVLTVTETWWGNYTHRAFNLSYLNGQSLVGVSAADIDAAFKIYVPKN